MITLLFIIFFLILAIKIRPTIKRYERSIYLFTTLLALLSLIFNQHPITTPIIQGFIGLALFFLVMMASSLKPKSIVRKSLMGLRKQYSIIGFIFITPHAIYYFLAFLLNDGIFTPFGIIAYLIMIPLFVTSFITIRKRMSSKTWKNLQRVAYLSYGLLLVHLILHNTQILNLFFYLLLAVIYFYLKFTIYVVPLVHNTSNKHVTESR